MDKSNVKTVLVFIIIFGCFGVLYSRIFYPLISSLFGMNRRTTTFHENYESAQYYEELGKSMKNKAHGESRSRPQTRMNGHPGRHALLEMKKYANQKQSSGGGSILGIILPLYAAGILIYLIYTLSRLFLCKKNKLSKTNLGFTEKRSYTDAYVSDVKGRVLKKQKELEKLLWKADHEDIGDEEITLLKKRLIETENQMTRILEAMNVIQKTTSSCYSQDNSIMKEDSSQDELSLERNNKHMQNEGFDKLKKESGGQSEFFTLRRRVRAL